MIVRSYARHISTEAAFSTIIADVRPSNERITMDPKTFDEYFEALSDLYIRKSEIRISVPRRPSGQRLRGILWIRPSSAGHHRRGELSSERMASI